MEDVAGVDLHPGDVAGAVEVHHPDAGAELRFPAGEGSALHQGGQVEHRRKVEEHGVTFGDDEVVHHHRSGQLDLGGAQQRAVG